MCARPHFNICKYEGAKLYNKHRYDHITKSVESSHDSKVSILWNQQVRTDRIIPKNKQDITIRDNKQGTCMLIDVAIPGEEKCDQERSREDLKI